VIVTGSHAIAFCGASPRNIGTSPCVNGDFAEPPVQAVERNPGVRVGRLSAGAPLLAIIRRRRRHLTWAADRPRPPGRRNGRAKAERQPDVTAGTGGRRWTTTEQRSAAASELLCDRELDGDTPLYVHGQPDVVEFAGPAFNAPVNDPP
jgi:hypothetical protein